MEPNPDIPELEDLPDLDAVRARAYQRRDHYARVAAEAQEAVDQAQEQIDLAEAYIARISGGVVRSRPGKRPTDCKIHNKRVSDSAYTAALTALTVHGYASYRTLSQAASISTSHLTTIMGVAERNGHVIREIRGKKHRFTLTELGTDFITAPVENV